MKTRIFLYGFLLSFCVSSVWAQGNGPEFKREISRNDFKLKGAVKQVIQECLSVSGVEQLMSIDDALGDTNGALLFNEQGNIVFKAFNGFSWRFRYDGEGNISEETKADEKELCTYNYAYDGGNLTEITGRNKDSVLCVKIVYSYNGEGRPTEKIREQYKNLWYTRKYRTRNTYRYDSLGNLTEVCEHLPNGMTGKTTKQYDADGNAVKEQRDVYRKDGRFFEHSYSCERKYDAQGRLTEMRRSSPANIFFQASSYRCKYKYDEYGSISGISTITGTHRDITEYEYTYDDIGNWIEKECWTNGNLQYTITRNIDYYH